MIRKNKKQEQFKLITDSSFPFAAKEAYNSLRTNLLYALSPTNGKIVAVTSSNAGEGKSTVSINLALTMASANVKVLLIDADLRRPTIHKKLRIDNSTGLSKFIVGFETMSDSLKRNVFTNLDVMTSGPIPPNPSELLGSENMRVFLQKASDYYDYIIAMDSENIEDIQSIIGFDKDNKIKRLLDYTNKPRNIRDPWYTGNFEETYNDVVEGCKALLDTLIP